MEDRKRAEEQAWEEGKKFERPDAILNVIASNTGKYVDFYQYERGLVIVKDKLIYLDRKYEHLKIVSVKNSVHTITKERQYLITFENGTSVENNVSDFYEISVHGSVSFDKDHHMFFGGRVYNVPRGYLVLKNYASPTTFHVKSYNVFLLRNKHTRKYILWYINN